MALSNIGNEPRREITESAIGVLAIVVWLGMAFLIARIIDPPYVNGPHDYSASWLFTVSFVTFIVATLGPLLLFGTLFITHEIGEVVCDWLKALRIDPRPTQRYGRNGR